MPAEKIERDEYTPFELKMLDGFADIREKNVETAEALKKQDARFDGLDEEMKGFRAQLDTDEGAREVLAQEAATRAAITVEGSDLMTDCPALADAEKKAGRKFSMAKAMLGIKRKDGPARWDECELERETFEEMQSRNQKAQVHQIDSDGGFLVPEQVDGQVIELLKANSVVRSAGARVMGGLTGVPLRLPKRTSATTQFWVGERQQITDSEMQFGQVTLSPKKSAALVRHSQEFLRFGGSGADAIVTEDLAEQLALGEDLAFLRGSGSEFQPLGMANHPGINTTALAGAITWEHFIDMMFELMVDNAFRGRLAWIYHPRLWRDIAKVFDADGRPIWNATGTTSERPDSGSIYAIPTFSTTQIPIDLTPGTATELYLSNMQDVVIGEWSGLILARSDQFLFDTDEVAVKATRLVDMGVRLEESIVLDNTIVP